MELLAQCVRIVEGEVKSCGRRTSAWKMLIQTCDFLPHLYSRCKKCKGKKTVKEKTRQEIFVERGMSDRQRIVLSGAGDEEVRHCGFLLPQCPLRIL